MANASHNTEADPREVERALQGWHAFTRMAKYSIMAIVASVVLLAWITL